MADDEAAAAMSALSMSETGEEEILIRFRAFMQAKGIVQKGVLAFVAHRNWETNAVHIVVDFKSAPARVVDVYPGVFGRAPKEGSVGSFLFGYHDGLDASVLSPKADAVGPVAAAEPKGPFCCGSLSAYRPNCTAHDIKFSSFLSQVGTEEEVVFCVKSQVDFGPLLGTKYWSLKDSIAKEESGTFTQKLHAFKNYKCATHKMFFAVDLYKASDEAGGNIHHMRPSAFTSRNDALLHEFLTAAGV